jgi:hypothetical protein
MVNDVELLFELGRFYAIVAGAMAADQELTTAEREEATRTFVDRAVGFVRAARDEGFRDADRIKDLKDYKESAPLRQNAEVQALLKSLDGEKEASGK